MKHYFFVGIAGTGMSAIAQYLRGSGEQVSGSDRLFASSTKMLLQEQLEQQGINCYLQDASGIDPTIDVLVISTAIEESNVELQKARALGIQILKRSELLAFLSSQKRTIAVGGTSGKSTTSAMIFHILQTCGYEPSIMSGAGLTSLQHKGLPGNAWVGKSDWLVIESDESDGSIVNYIPEIAVVLNIDRDHKEFDELLQLFATFKANTRGRFVVNQSHPMCQPLSQDVAYDFGVDLPSVGFSGTDFRQEGFAIHFRCQGVEFSLPVIGRHNMENALAAIAICSHVGISLSDSSQALKSYLGIYRRTQLVGIGRGITVVDDFAHNPAEVAAAIEACQSVGRRVFAWFQPHGFGPLRFMHEELIERVLQTLRPEDSFWLSKVYYAGGTVSKEIDSEQVARSMQQRSDRVYYYEDRASIVEPLAQQCQEGDVILVMGARDTTLSDFSLSLLAAL